LEIYLKVDGQDMIEKKRNVHSQFFVSVIVGLLWINSRDFACFILYVFTYYSHVVAFV